MAVNLIANAPALQTWTQDSQADRLLSRSALSGTSTPSGEDTKALKAGKDFESVLLGSWLQQAQQTFATVPGGDSQDDQDPGKDQFQGIAMQALAGSLTASGGIGIARLITNSLRTSQGKFTSSAASAASSAYSPNSTISGAK